MKPRLLILTAIVVSCLMLLQIGCQEQAQPVPQSKPELVVPKPAVSLDKAEVEQPKTDKQGPRITFEKTVHDFGKVGIKAKKTCQFKFTNTGDSLLKVTKVKACCGFSAQLNKGKREYAPGEKGIITVTSSVLGQPGRIRKLQHVYSNDKKNPNVTLTVRAMVVTKVDYKPKKLNLSLKDENAGCPKITIRSVDDQPFAVRSFKSTSNSITADFDPSVKATEFVFEPKVDIEKLRKSLNGRIHIKLTHPECDRITIGFKTLPEFVVEPKSLVILKAEPEKPVVREVWILNNYGNDFEVESTLSQKGLIKVLSQEKVDSRYKFTLEVTPPAEAKARHFSDVFFVNIKDGKKLRITCRGFYSKKK